MSYNKIEDVLVKYCLECDTEMIGRNTKHFRIRKYCSVECKNKAHSKLMTENNPMKGKRHTKSTKDKIHNVLKGKRTGKNNSFYGQHHTQKTKEAISHANMGRKVSEEVIKKRARYGKDNLLYGRHLSPDTKSKISKTRIARGCGKGKTNFWYGKIPPHGKWEEYKGYKMRSSYEIAYAKYLDSKNIKWIYEPRYFELVINNKETTYTPDFYLPKENKYIEIKGYWRGDAKAKFAMFRKTYSHIKIVILMKKELKELGIMK